MAIDRKKVIKILKKGGVGVLLTDTLYGLVGQALNKKAVIKIYKIKGRNPKKPFIILIHAISDLEKMGVDAQRLRLNKFWPGPVSVILPCPSKKFSYLHRGTKSIALRMPKKKSLIKILEKTGPLVAPSANPENLPPAQNITEAKKYFGPKADFYLAGGKPKKRPSKLIKIENGKEIILR